MKNSHTTQKVLSRVLRGDLNFQELKSYGFAVHHVDGLWNFPEYSGSPISVSIADVLNGFRALQFDKARCTEWAQFVLAASGYYDLSELEREPLGDDCLEALWDLCRGDFIPMHNLLRELTDRD